MISKSDYDGTKMFVLNILDDLSDWETVDALALRVVVNLVKQNREEMFSLLKEWATSRNKWIRRLSMSTIAPYIRSRPDDARLCLEIVEKLMYEKDKDVKKPLHGLQERYRRKIQRLYVGSY